VFRLTVGVSRFSHILFPSLVQSVERVKRDMLLANERHVDSYTHMDKRNASHKCVA